MAETSKSEDAWDFYSKGISPGTDALKSFVSVGSARVKMH